MLDRSISFEQAGDAHAYVEARKKHRKNCFEGIIFERLKWGLTKKKNNVI